MKKLFLLHIFLCLWIVAFSDKHEHVSPTPVGEFNSVIFLSFLGNKLPFAVLGCTIDHTDVEIVNFAPFYEPNTHIGNLIWSNDTHLSKDASLDSFQNVGTVIRNDSNGLVFGMEYGIPVLSKAGHSYQGESKYEKQPFHGANITKNG